MLFLSPELVHRPSEYLASCTNGKLDWISSSFSKRQRQRKLPLIAERGRYFLATQQQAIDDKNQGDECQRIWSKCWKLWRSNCFLYSVYVSADWPRSQVQKPPHRSASQHIWTIWHTDNRQPQGHISQEHKKCVCSSGAKGHNASPGCSERGGVTFYWLIYINNRTQTAEKAASIETKAWRKCCQCCR